MLYSAKIISLKETKNEADLFDNKIIASGTIYNQILLWNASNGIILDVFKDGHQGVIFNIDFCYQTTTLFSVSDDRSINVWKLSSTDSILNKNESKLVTRFYGNFLFLIPI